jgi:fructose-specific phosphotransferase system IIA component
MKLSKFCDESLVVFDLKADAKQAVLEELVALVSESKMVKDRAELLSDIKEREELVTTGVGYGVAFPHAKTRAVKGIVIAFGRSQAGIDFDAMDHKSVHLFFLIAAPEDAVGAHLNVMARLSYLMKSEENRQALLKATSPGDVLSLMDGVE